MESGSNVRRAVVGASFVTLGIVSAIALPKPSFPFQTKMLTVVAMPWVPVAIYVVNFLIMRKSGELPSEHSVGDMVDGRFGKGTYRATYPFLDLLVGSNLTAVGLTLLWHPAGGVPDGVLQSAALFSSFGVAMLAWCAVARLLNLYSNGSQ